MKKILFVLFSLTVLTLPLSAGKFYQNDILGIKIQCPEGWYIIPGTKIEKGTKATFKDIAPTSSLKESVDRVGILVVFSKVPPGEPVEYAANISLVREPINIQYIKDSLRYAKSSILTIKQVFKDVVITQQPRGCTLSGLSATNFEYEGTIVRGYLQTRIKSRVYLFLKGNFGYAITFTALKEEFPLLVNKFEEVIKTFIIK